MAGLLFIVSRTERERYLYLKHEYADETREVILDRRADEQRRSWTLPAERRQVERRHRDIALELQSSGWALVTRGGERPDESLLRETAREAIHSGKLPASQPDRTTWAGKGSGAACAVCGKTVNTDQIGLEIEFERSELGKYSLHTKCFSAWEFERTEVERSSLRGRLST